MVRLIGLEDLLDGYKVYLEDSFRKELIRKAVEQTDGLVKLSKSVGVDWSSLCKIRRGYRILKGKQSIYFVKIGLLKKLLKLTQSSIRETEKHVTGIAYSKHMVKVKLPIIASTELASLVGHAIGDGHASTERFKYINKSKELTSEVKQFTKEIFGIDGRDFIYKDCFGIEYPGIVGRLLSLIGVPLGRKVIQEIKISEWIKSGSKEIKSAFIRALFDDEGSFVLGKHQKFISISMYKRKELVGSHLEFLEELRGILIELGIRPSKISFKKDWKDTKEFGFRIYSKQSLMSFYTHVGFTHKIKNHELSYYIENYNNLKL
ncbi:MAG: hypothetical protein HYW24_03140 [Candidatus Aenigmarchaeota archaeon]|nr:hypothetical protein [Candidatus Aenigmarchaeota archaeon]